MMVFVSMHMFKHKCILPIRIHIFVFVLIEFSVVVTGILNPTGPCKRLENSEGSSARQKHIVLFGGYLAAQTWT